MGRGGSMPGGIGWPGSIIIGGNGIKPDPTDPIGPIGIGADPVFGPTNIGGGGMKPASIGGTGCINMGGAMLSGEGKEGGFIPSVSDICIRAKVGLVGLSGICGAGKTDSENCPSGACKKGIGCMGIGIGIKP